MGERSQREAGRCAIISDLVTCSGMTPSPVDILCASQTNGLTPCSVAPFLSHRQAIPPLTHTCTHTHTHHTPSHTPHTLHKHTHSSHPHSHILFTHTHSFTYTHPHTFLTYSQTYSSYPYKHTPSHTPYLHTHTHIQSLQEHRHRKHGDPAGVLTHQAHGVCGNSPESQLRSVAGASTYWEPLGLLEAP